MTRTEERGRAILEIFAEAQGVVADKTTMREAALRLVLSEKKAADNAEQHKNRQCDSGKRAARNAGKRAQHAKRRSSRPTASETERAAARARKIETQRAYREANRERERARQRAYREGNRVLLADKERHRRKAAA
jgi:hypothetical protein